MWDFIEGIILLDLGIDQMMHLEGGVGQFVGQNQGGLSCTSPSIADTPKS